MKFIEKLLVFGLLFIIVLMGFSCRKRVDQLSAKTQIDIISLSFGNSKDNISFTIQNTGEKTLNFSLTEQIPWLELDKSNGEIPGNDSAIITASVSREGLAKNRYEGIIDISTTDKNTRLTAYLTVDMFLVTVLNPVFTTISIEVDSTIYKTSDNTYLRLIGAGDSTQFSYFDKPNLFIFKAQTSGRYTDSTQLGLQMQWNQYLSLSQTETPRIFLNVSGEYFFLTMVNAYQNLFPVYVNAGTIYEKVENIVVFQSVRPLPIGYYEALENTVVRAYLLGSPLNVTWSQGDQFYFPFVENQFITLENYLSDTVKNSTPIKHIQVKSSPALFDKNYGDVIDVYSIR